MNEINRDNYETFFLLYTDNELSATEKKAVDIFVQNNPDLQEELVMLQQSILKPDDTVFGHKGGLLRYEPVPSPMQEELFLLLDNELPAPAKNAIIELIKTDAAFEKEWGLLQQTMLNSGEAVLFNDKQSLYRKEAGRLVYFPWRKIAVAAVLIGLGVWGGMRYFTSNNKVDNAILAKKIPNKPASSPTKPSKKEPGQPILPAPVEEIATAEISNSNRQANTRLSQEKTINTVTTKIAAGELQVLVAKEKNNNLPEPYFENVNKGSSNKIITAIVTPENQKNDIVDPGNNATIKSKEKQDAASNFVSNASYIDNTEENNDRILFMDEEKVKKTKLGGIFRKVKRVLERNANIKPGNGNHIKVANLEFAIQ